MANNNYYAHVCMDGERLMTNLTDYGTVCIQYYSTVHNIGCGYEFFFIVMIMQYYCMVMDPVLGRKHAYGE